jgi:hypothetical protein
MLTKLAVEPNKPVQVALKFSGGGKLCEGKYGNQKFFTLSTPAGHCIYLDLEPAAIVEALNPQAGQPFWLAKKWTGKKTDAPVWDAWPVEERPAQLPRPALPAIPGGRDERTLEALEAARAEALQRLDEITRKQQAVASTGDRQPPKTTPPAGSPLKTQETDAHLPPEPMTTPGDRAQAKAPAPAAIAEPRREADCAIEAHANLLIDAYAAVLARTLTKYEGRVKPDESRAIILTAVIKSARDKRYA